MRRNLGFLSACSVLLLLLLGSGCTSIQISGSSITSTPSLPFSREQAIARAKVEATVSAPELGLLEVELTSEEAELLTLAEADKRFGGERGPGGYAAGQTPDSPVWWVKVHGHFRYEGMPSADCSYPIYEADERDFAYDARTGQSVGSGIPASRFISPGAPRETIQPPSPAPSPTPTHGPADLTVEENPIAKFETAPDRMEYLQLIPRDVLDRHMRDRNWPPDRRAESANGVISRYGFRLQHDPPLSSYTYLLYRGDQLLLDQVDGFGAAIGNARGDDFVLYIRSDKHGDKLLGKDGLRDWKPRFGRFCPSRFRGRRPGRGELGGREQQGRWTSGRPEGRQGDLLNSGAVLRR